MFSICFIASAERPTRLRRGLRAGDPFESDGDLCMESGDAKGVVVPWHMFRNAVAEAGAVIGAPRCGSLVAFWAEHVLTDTLRKSLKL